MSIILNEYEWAEKAIRDRDLGKKPYETLLRVGKYYIFNGYNKRKTRDMLESFVIQCDPKSSIAKMSGMLDGVLKAAAKYPPVILDCIQLTKPEMDKIDSLDGRQIRKLAFTLLCIAKYKKAVNERSEYWVNTPDNEIMSMANVSTSIKRQSALFAQLRDLGMVRFSKKIDNLDVQVLFAEDGPPATTITDFRNLGYQYLKYIGEPYFECACCGITTKMDNPGRGRRQKYCRDCAVKVKIQQSVNPVMDRKRRSPVIDAQG